MTATNTQQLFSRAWAVTIGLPGLPGKKYTGLRITFDIDKTSYSSANKAKVEVCNLSAQSRQNYENAQATNLRSAYQLQLQAGYSGNLRTIYLGDIRTSKNRREGATIITTFELGTSEKQLLYSTLNRSYPPGTAFLTILKDLAMALNVDVGTVVGVKSETYSGSVAFVGSVKASLDQMTLKQGLRWQVQDGRLNVFPADSHLGQTAIVLSSVRIPSMGISRSGLVGVPSQNQGMVQFEALLNPSIIPGALVQIWSESIKGDFFRVNRAHFQGDSHGAKWSVACEAAPIKAIQTLTTSFTGAT